MADISTWIDRNAAFHPDKPAIRFQGDTLTYAAMSDRIQAMAAALHNAYGVRKGDRIAWLGTNHPDLLVLLFAAARCGAILAPMNWRLAAPEHAYVLQDADVAVLFAQHPFLGQLSGETLPGGCRVVDLGDPGETGARFDALLADAGPVPAAEGGAEDPLLLVYTSGTTGRPKGAVLTQDALTWNAVNSTHMHDMTSQDHVLSALPMFHVGGLNIQTTPALHLGATVTILDRFEPGTYLAALRDLRPTLSVLVPATIAAILAHPDWAGTDIGCLRALATGSMIVPRELIAAVHARNVPVIQVYGSSETAPIAIYQRIADAFETVGSMGRPGLHTDIRVVRRDGGDAGIGEPGELLVRGRHVARAYWKDEEASRETFRDGWYRSGDVAEVDENGLYWFRDRIKNVIISGGENIYPAEPERILREIPGIRECCVVGRPDSKWGAVPVAIVAAEDGVTKDRIIAHFDGRLARYKQPRDVVFVPELPKNALGKVVIDEAARLAAGPEGNDG